MYEITLNAKDAVDLICDTGFEVNHIKFKPSAVYSREKLVSFLNVSYYVPDEEITKKLVEFGAELVTPIRRRMHPGTNIADGTRFVVVRFPNERQSLPYTMKMPTGINSHEYIRVIHDNQRKVCTQCFEASHVYANCPDNICFKCDKAGHLARNCQEPPCARCNKYPAKCRCEPVWGVNKRVRQDDEGVNDGNGENRMEDDVADVSTGKEKEPVGEAVNEKDDAKTVDNGDVNESEQLTNDNIDKHVNDDKKNVGGSQDLPGPVPQSENVDMADAGHEKVPESSMSEQSEKEMSDEELAQAMSRISRRRRLVTTPYLSADDIKRLRSNPRHKLTPKSDSHS